jgi:hypothetical protein
MIAPVDRAGYCAVCQREIAEGRPYINWDAFTANWHGRGWKWEGERCRARA